MNFPSVTHPRAATRSCTLNVQASNACTTILPLFFQSNMYFPLFLFYPLSLSYSPSSPKRFLLLLVARVAVCTHGSTGQALTSPTTAGAAPPPPAPPLFPSPSFTAEPVELHEAINGCRHYFFPFFSFKASKSIPSEAKRPH